MVLIGKWFAKQKATGNHKRTQTFNKFSTQKPCSDFSHSAISSHSSDFL
jgi:hypothetical protein